MDKASSLWREVWIEAEHWAAGEWDPDDTNADVIVTLSDGSRWVATFFTYANIESLRQKNATTGECLGGSYWWATDMLLVHRLTRETVELIVHHLLDVGDFEAVFSQADGAEEV